MLVWDATCSDTIVPSHFTLAAWESRAAAVDADQRKWAIIKVFPPRGHSLLHPCGS